MKLDDFKCRMCGACCRIKDGIVRVSDAEVARIAAFLGMGEAEFIERETLIAPDRKSLILKSRPDGSCAYLTEDNLCRINPVKPDKCRTFPFEWVNPDSAEVCPELVETSSHSASNGASVRLSRQGFEVRDKYNRQN
jgi:Fe-S-cluster containining protein